MLLMSVNTSGKHTTLNLNKSMQISLEIESDGRKINIHEILFKV